MTVEAKFWIQAKDDFKLYPIPYSIILPALVKHRALANLVQSRAEHNNIAQVQKN